MRIAFATPYKLEFGVDSAYQIPLGGSDSALCYLAEALAQQGHEVFLLHNTSAPGLSRGVHCLRAEPQVVKTLQPLDVLVVQNATGWARLLPPSLVPSTPLVLWTQLAHDRPAMRALHDPDERGSYAGIAFVSEWQRRQFLQHFGIDLQRSAVLRNAIGPAFGGLFADGSAVLARKSRPPVLAYTSTPFRGLNVLLDVLPEIRRRVPGTTLKIYSSMRVYQVANTLDEANFGKLYRQCRETDGVEYLGSVPQPVLARELRSVALLAYPNTFEETSCIAVLEAMAAGCWIVTSDLAALPETTAGFARLIPLVNSGGVDYRKSFVEAVVEVLGQFTGPTAAAVEAHLRRQVSYVNESCTWPARARQWVDWLSSLRPRTTPAASGQGLLPAPLSTGPAPAAPVAELFALAWQHHQAGNFAQAEQLYRQILQNDPSHANAWGYLGSVCQAQGKLAEAERSFRGVVQLLPGNASAHNCLAVVLVQRNNLEEAAASLQDALRCQPENAETHNNLGSVFVRLGRTTEAMDSYRQALRLAPDHAQAHYNLGLALKTAGQQVAALAEFQEALRCQPDFAEAMHDRGDVLAEQKSLEAAESSYRQALRLRPNRPETHHNLGIALESQGRLDEAIVSYQQALGLNPNFAQANFNLGNALQRRGRFEEAVASYRQVLALNPNFAEGHSNLGQALLALGRFDEASACFRRALELKPDSAAIHVNLAGVLKEQGQLEEAVACYRRALELDSDNPGVLAGIVSQLQRICLWKDLNDLSQRVIEGVAKNAAGGSAAAVDPFLFLTLPTPTTADQHRQCAYQWVEQLLKSVRGPACEVQRQDSGHRASHIAHRTSHIAHSRITVGYLSADFQEHATAYLIAELIEKHERQRFAVFGYSLGSDDGGPLRRRLVKAFDRFVDLKDTGVGAAARRIQADEVDILVDLKGYTRRARTQIMALRPAPLQVNYLGYPGTMAAPFIDYILVDDFVVPPEQQPFFTEKLVYLPGCYQVNDSQRQIAAQTPSRAEFGLPEVGFVFCCFNSSHKITPQVFEVWMRLLKNVPGSVLWLLEDNSVASANLRREAQAQGVMAERLVFGPCLALAEHLARHRLADLFLDTLPFNAHTTASDALWSGCPVLTMAGQTFPSRVAGSLLRTIGLPELITTSFQEYENLALRLARDADLLNGLRARLQANRKTSRLFDGGQFARSLEQAFIRMWEIYTSGEEPRGFTVPHQPEAQAR